MSVGRTGAGEALSRQAHSSGEVSYVRLRRAVRALWGAATARFSTTVCNFEHENEMGLLLF